MALLDSGEVYSWGWNRNGQLGDGTTQDRSCPNLTEAMPGKVVGIAAGDYHSLARLESGEFYSWGWNQNGQIGDGTTQERYHPQLIKDIPNKGVGIAAGDHHSLALIEDGKIYSWGTSDEGQLGDGTTKRRKRPQLIKDIPDKVVSIAASGNHSLALLESGDVYGWGWNDEGQLGDGTTKRRKCPQLIKDIPDKVVGIAAGAYHSVAFLRVGKFMAGGEIARDNWGTEPLIAGTNPK